MTKNIKIGNLLSAVNKFRKAHLIVVGDIILDQFIWGKVRRINPEAPVPVVEVENTTFRLGGAANVAAGIAALGGKVSLCGILGDSRYGDEVCRLLDEHHINREGVVRDPTRPTTLKTRIIAHNQQVVRYDTEVRDEPTREIARQIFDWLSDNITHADAVILSDYDKGVLRGKLGQHAIALGKKAGAIVTVDPKVPNISKFAGADVITPNQIEAEQIAGIKIVDDASLERAGRFIMRKFKTNGVLITRGEAGMSLFLPHEETLHIPAVARQVFDVTGAGDTVIASFTLALASGTDYFHSAWLANSAAAVTVGKIGTATVSAIELKKILKEEIKWWLRRK